MSEDIISQILRIPDGVTAWPDGAARPREDPSVKIFTHAPSGVQVAMHTKDVVRMDNETLKKFIEKGRVMMIDSVTKVPLKEYEGLPLQSFDSIVSARMAQK